MAHSNFGQTLLRRFLELLLNSSVAENVRPPWLRGLEIDLWVERWRLAFEFQGDQHYSPVYGAGCLQTQKTNDKLKRQLCEANEVTLIRIDACDLEYTRLVGKIRNALRPRGRHRTRDAFRSEIDRTALRALNNEATDYRRVLTRSFSSPTAHRKHSAIRRTAGRTQRAKLATAD